MLCSLFLGFCITPAILHSQLEHNCIFTHHLGSLLNPNDEQHVMFTISLIQVIWSLPPAPAGCDLAFALACHTLNIYGEFAWCLILPYISIDQNIDEKLIHLSVAMHLAFLLYCHNHMSTQFMPRQLYLNIICMIKNVFFCITKMKIDNLGANFYLVLLRTDHSRLFLALYVLLSALIQMSACVSLVAVPLGWQRWSQY